MAIEHACMRAVRKPWGSIDLRPWSNMRNDGVAIGELWFQRPDINAPDPALLLKLLFTTEPLSIQVHPDDAFAQSIGLEHGKTEAWYILSATPGAKIASRAEAAAHDSAIADLDRGRFDFGPRSMAPRLEGRRHFRPSRHDPRHRPRTRDCGNPAEKRRDVPPF